MDSTICDREVGSTICGGEVIPVKVDGRFWYHRGVFINIPRDFVTCQCKKCGHEYVSDEMIIALNKILDQELFKKESSGWNLIDHANLIDQALERDRERNEFHTS